MRRLKFHYNVTMNSESSRFFGLTRISPSKIQLAINGLSTEAQKSFGFEKEMWYMALPTKIESSLTLNRFPK